MMCRENAHFDDKLRNKSKRIVMKIRFAESQIIEFSLLTFSIYGFFFPLKNKNFELNIKIFI